MSLSENIAKIRNSVYGKDVREAIAASIEGVDDKCAEYASQAETSAETATEAAQNVTEAVASVSGVVDDVMSLNMEITELNEKDVVLKNTEQFPLGYRSGYFMPGENEETQMGRSSASSNNIRTISCLDVQKNAKVTVKPNDGNSCRIVAFSSDSPSYANGADNSSIYLWGVETEDEYSFDSKDGEFYFVSQNVKYTDISESVLPTIRYSSALTNKIASIEERVTALEGEYVTEYTEKEDAFVNKVKADFEAGTLTLLVVADTHYNETVERGKYQPKYAKAFVGLAEKIGVDAMIHLGDMVDEDKSENKNPIVNINRMHTMMDVYKKSSLPFLYAIAHHECKPYDQNVNDYVKVPRDKIFGIGGKYNRYAKLIFADGTKGRTSYYTDFDQQKIRLIVLDSVSKTEVGFEQAVVDFLVSSLNSIGDGYKVIVATHCSTRYLRTYIGFNTKIENALNSFVDNGGTVLAYVCGHTHYDAVIKDADMKYPIIMLAAQSVANYEGATEFPEEYEPVYYLNPRDRSTNAYDAYLITAMTFNAKTDKVNCYRFGCGRKDEDGVDLGGDFSYPAT